MATIELTPEQRAALSREAVVYATDPASNKQYVLMSIEEFEAFCPVEEADPQVLAGAVAESERRLAEHRADPSSSRSYEQILKFIDALRRR